MELLINIIKKQLKFFIFKLLINKIQLKGKGYN